MTSPQNSNSASPKLLPLFIKTEGLRCLIVGGGKVALRKVEQLLAVGAAVSILAPEAKAQIKALHCARKVNWLDRAYKRGDIEGYHLVIAATDDYEVNRGISDEARERNILVNVVDDPELCDVYFGAIWREGGLIGALCTSGKAPFLSRAFRNRLENASRGWGDWLETGAKFRDFVRRAFPDEVKREEFYNRFIAIGPRAGRVDFIDNLTPEEWLERWRRLPTIEKFSSD